MAAVPAFSHGYAKAVFPFQELCNIIGLILQSFVIGGPARSQNKFPDTLIVQPCFIHSQRGDRQGGSYRGLGQGEFFAKNRSHVAGIKGGFYPFCFPFHDISPSSNIFLYNWASQNRFWLIPRRPITLLTIQLSAEPDFVCRRSITVNFSPFF